MSCDVDHRCSSDLALLWLWCRLRTSMCPGVALKRQNNNNNSGPYLKGGCTHTWSRYSKVTSTIITQSPLFWVSKRSHTWRFILLARCFLHVSFLVCRVFFFILKKKKKKKKKTLLPGKCIFLLIYPSCHSLRFPKLHYIFLEGK